MTDPRRLDAAIALLLVACGGSAGPAPTPSSPPVVVPPAPPNPVPLEPQPKAARPCSERASGPWRGQPIATVPVSPDDPLHGDFSLEQATAGLPGEGPLVAVIRTDHGDLRCELLADLAPRNVANFVGLARGVRPFKDPRTARWVKRPAYDGTTFHRIIAGFMIQGGDPKGDGTGEPGYVLPDEIWEGALHDRRGLLCTANRGPNTNGMQFFVTDGAATHLDGGFTIFGRCAPDAVIASIARASPDVLSASIAPPRIDSVRIERASAPCADR